MKHITQQTAVELAKKLEDGWADGPAEDYPNYDAGTWQLCNAAIDHYLSTLSAELPEPVALLDGVPLGAHTVGEVKANYDEVICPQCCNQFRAVPVNVQTELYDMERKIEKLVSDRDVLLEAMRSYSNALNWDRDFHGTQRKWLEPDSNTPRAYDGFDIARAAIQKVQP